MERGEGGEWREGRGGTYDLLTSTDGEGHSLSAQVLVLGVELDIGSRVVATVEAEGEMIGHKGKVRR
jgi:hypothetical protein